MVVARERLEDVAVVLDAVAPIVLAHELARGVELRDAPRQAVEEMADLAELVPAELLRLDERLQHVHCEPGMLLGERAADANHVHDRKDLRAPEVILLHRPEVREEPGYIRRAAQKARRESSQSNKEERRKLAQLQELENTIAELEAKLANLSMQLESPFVKPAEAAKLGTEYERVQKEMDQKLGEWERMQG